MNLEQAQRLKSLHHSGHKIKIESKHFKDGFAENIFEALESDVWDADGEITVGEIVYNSSVYQARPLAGIDVKDVEVFKKLDWLIPESKVAEKPLRALTDEMYDDLMTTALEGGITGWCCKCLVKDDDFRGAEFASDAISKGGTLMLQVYKTLGGEIKELTAEMIDEALVRTGRIGKGVETTWFNDFVDGGVDAVEADIIIQEAIFGSVIYS